MAISLITRADKGTALTITEHDANLDAIEGAVNTLETTVADLSEDVDTVEAAVELLGSPTVDISTMAAGEFAWPSYIQFVAGDALANPGMPVYLKWDSENSEPRIFGVDADLEDMDLYLPIGRAITACYAGNAVNVAIFGKFVMASDQHSLTDQTVVGKTLWHSPDGPGVESLAKPTAEGDHPMASAIILRTGTTAVLMSVASSIILKVS